MNKAALKMVNVKAWRGLMTPAGTSRFAVRGLRASYFQSKNRLKAIAALRAKIMQSNTLRNKISLFKNQTHENPSFTSTMPKVKPIKAKGKAKTVWLNLIKDK